jgi:FkbM family methyltransferase
MALTGEDKLQLVRIREGAYGYADLAEGFLRLIVIDGEFEAELLSLADRFLVPGGVCFDIGANYGLVTFGLAGRHGSVDFHLFEPNQHVILGIERTRKLYPGARIRVVPKAVSDREGLVSFRINEEHTGSSHVDPGGAQTVETITLDHYLEAQNIARVDFLKIDVEGHELSALRGAERALSRRAIRVIYFEYFEGQLARDRGADALLRFLADAGYEVCCCVEYDLKLYPATHTVRSGLPGHGVRLSPLAGRQPPPATNLLAVPKDDLVALRPPAG